MDRAATLRKRYAEDPAFAAKRRQQARESFERHSFKARQRVYLRLVEQGKIRNPKLLHVYAVDSSSLDSRSCNQSEHLHEAGGGGAREPHEEVLSVEVRTACVPEPQPAMQSEALT